MDKKYDGCWIVDFENNERWEKCVDILKTKIQAVIWGESIMKEDNKLAKEDQEFKQHKYFIIGQINILKSQVNLFRNSKNYIIVNKEKIHMEDFG